MVKRFYSSIGLSCLLAMSLLFTTSSLSLAQMGSPLYQRYMKLQTEANELFKRGELTKAIERFEQALQIAPETSLAAATNNLAATYMRRANYYTKVKQDDTMALPDYQQAVYWLKYAWPQGVPKKPLHEDNTEIAEQQLNQAYRRLRVPDTVEAHLRAARQFRQQGQFRNAIVSYQEVLKLEANHQEARLGLGDLYTVLNRPDLATVAYKQVAEQEAPLPEGQEALVRLANSLQKQGDLEQAVDVLNQALEEDPNNKAALMMLEKLWRDEVKHNPNNAIAHANLARVFQQQQRYPLAQKAYDLAERLIQRQGQPMDVKMQVRLNRASFYEATQQWPLAEQAYSSILEVQPENTEALERLALIYQHNKRPDAAVAIYRNALKPGQEQDQASLHVTLLNVIGDLPEQRQQEQALENYAAAHPNSSLVAAAVGEKFHGWEQYDKAVRYYERAVHLDPNDATTWANLGLAQLSRGNSERAVDALEQARRLDPTNSMINEQAAQAIQQEGYRLYTLATEALQRGNRSQEALRHLERAVALEPDNPTYLLALGISQQQAEQTDKAIKTYSDYMALKPKDSAVYYYRGTAYQQQDNLSAAKKDYEKALSLNSGNTEAKQALAQVKQLESETQLAQAQGAFEVQRYEEALKRLEPLTKSGSTNSLAFYYKGLSLNELKRYKEAVPAFQRALELDSNLAEATYALALAYDQTQQTALAKQTYARFIQQVSGPEQTIPPEQQPYVDYARERLGS